MPWYTRNFTPFMYGRGNEKITIMKHIIGFCHSGESTPMTYDAFISYSHARDRQLAGTIRRALQAFARPWYKRRTMRVFLDNASLSASPALWSSIEKALHETTYFILF